MTNNLEARLFVNFEEPGRWALEPVPEYYKFSPVSEPEQMQSELLRQLA